MNSVLMDLDLVKWFSRFYCLRKGRVLLLESHSIVLNISRQFRPIALDQPTFRFMELFILVGPRACFPMWSVLMCSS
ncbi:hypothetical protein BOC37_16550 [Burkholderia pseudomallei]|nr:hypothetical protein BOC37_16550 [Burkholderia pseudomallei]